MGTEEIQALRFGHPSVCIANIDDGKDLDVKITRAEYEEFCSDLFNRMLDPVEEVLYYGDKESRREINHIILIGSSPKMPFSGVERSGAVAKGARITAEYCKGGIGPGGAAKCDDIVLLALGVQVGGGVMSVVVPHGVQLPVREIQLFFAGVSHRRTTMLTRSSSLAFYQLKQEKSQ
jgi:molecular chaperone DnaK (HSP70)